MNAKTIALGLIVIIFGTFSVVYYEIVIQIFSTNRDVLKDIQGLKNLLVVSNDEAEIKRLISQSNELYDSLKNEAEALYAAFVVI